MPTVYARSAYRRSTAATARRERGAHPSARASRGEGPARPAPPSYRIRWSIVLELDRADTLRGSVEVGDGHSPPFSVGFTLKKRDVGWRVVSASPPG